MNRFSLQVQPQIIRQPPYVLHQTMIEFDQPLGMHEIDATSRYQIRRGLLDQ